MNMGRLYFWSQRRCRVFWFVGQEGAYGIIASSYMARATPSLAIQESSPENLGKYGVFAEDSDSSRPTLGSNFRN